MAPIVLTKSPDASSFTVNDIKGRKAQKIHAYSVSQLKMAMTCPRQRYFRYRLGFVIPPPGVVIVGRGTHKGIEMSLKNKQKTGDLLSINDISDIAAQETNRIIETEPVSFGEGEDGAESVDSSVKLARLWTSRIAPHRTPISLVEAAKIAWPTMSPRTDDKGRTSDASNSKFDGIEAGFELRLKDIEKPIIGFIDFVEATKRSGRVTIRDNKTAGKRKSEIELKGFQLATYALAAKKAQLEVDKVGLDVLLRPRPRTPAGDSEVMEGPAPTVPLLQQTYGAFRWLEQLDKAGEYPVCIGDHCGWCGYRKLCEKTGKIELEV